MVLVKFIRVNALSKGKRAKSLYRFVVCEGVRTSGVVELVSGLNKVLFRRRMNMIE